MKRNMKRKIMIIFAIMTVVFLFTSCSDENSDNSNFPSSTVDKMEKDSTPSTEIFFSEEAPATEEPKPPRTTVDGTIISDSFEFNGAEKYYLYTAPISGVYRFDLDIDNVNYDYRFKLLTQKEEVLVNVTYSDYEKGANCILEAGTEYYISVIQERELPCYMIKIGVPDTLSTINGNIITGELNFKNKKNEYIYKPNISGQYRFDFDISDVNCNYLFRIYGEKSELIISGYYSDKGVTCALEKDIEYKIHIIQKDGFPKFEISIGIPKKKRTISDGVISGSIHYIDQVDRYIYPLSQGTYFLSFSDINADSDIRVEIESSKKERIFAASKSEEDIQFEVDKDDEYTIFITQRTGFTDYTVRITE